MAILSPTITSDLANDIYLLTRLNSLEKAVSELNSRHNGNFVFSHDLMLKGKTGGPGFIKCRTAFGFTLIGQRLMQGNAVIIFRGTEYLADWLTNLNATASRSSFSQPVHDGFNQSFNSMKPQLEAFLNSLGGAGIHSIHCIGHSLGGALATLCAEWIRSSYGTKPYVYTFGSPRVGLRSFSNTCTNRIGSDRMFRVYHKTDVVPYIPIWPFVHTPEGEQAYYLPSPGTFPGKTYHSMTRYVASVERYTWLSMSALKAEQRTDNDILRWLKEDSPISLTITTLEWLNRAIVYVLKRCMRGAEYVLSQAFTSAFTLADQIAYILTKGIEFSENVSSLVLYLVKKIIRAIGYQPLNNAASLTKEFIQHILIQLQQRLNHHVQAALSATLVDGRAIE